MSSQLFSDKKYIEIPIERWTVCIPGKELYRNVEVVNDGLQVQCCTQTTAGIGNQHGRQGLETKHYCRYTEVV